MLSEAIVVWTGKGRFNVPEENDDLVLMEYGPELGRALLPQIHLLWDEYWATYSSVDEAGIATDEQERDRMVDDEFRARHPWLTEEAVEAFGWAYSYDTYW